MGKLLVEENVTEFTIERFIFIVPDLQQAIFHTEGVFEIVIQFIAGNFYIPPGQVCTVEQLNPFRITCFLLFGLAGNQSQHQD